MTTGNGIAVAKSCDEQTTQTVWSVRHISHDMAKDLGIEH
jgi:hypothetical protein